MGCSYVFGEDNVEVLTSQEEILDLNMNMLRFNGSFQMFSDGFGLSWHVAELSRFFSRILDGLVQKEGVTGLRNIKDAS